MKLLVSSKTTQRWLALFAVCVTIGAAMPAAADAVLTATGRNGGYDFKATVTQQPSGAYEASSGIFSYDWSFSVKQEPSGAYRVQGKTMGLAGQVGHEARLTITKEGAGAYRIKGTSSQHAFDLTVSKDESGKYVVRGTNLGYNVNLIISGPDAGPFTVASNGNTDIHASVTAKAGQAQHSGADMKQPLPLQVLLALSASVGSKGKSLQ